MVELISFRASRRNFWACASKRPENCSNWSAFKVRWNYEMHIRNAILVTIRMWIRSKARILLTADNMICARSSGMIAHLSELNKRLILCCSLIFDGIHSKLLQVDVFGIQIEKLWEVVYLCCCREFYKRKPICKWSNRKIGILQKLRTLAEQLIPLNSFSAALRILGSSRNNFLALSEITFLHSWLSSSLCTKHYWSS